ncbi:MAG: hypothetical protein JW795_17760 [Chitinivibrionales bacterium]|nr:hypothetical protein [Chitinivibrionales bacterium]
MSDYTIHTGEFHQDKETVQALLLENLPGNSVERIEWMYETYPGTAPLCSRIYDSKDTSLVGVMSLFRRKFLMNRKTVVCAIAGDLCIKPSHRSVGPALTLIKSTLRKAIDAAADIACIYSFPNNHSRAVIQRAGCQRIGNFTRFIKILSLSPALKNHIPFFPLIQCLLWPINLFLTIIARQDYRCTKKTYTTEFPATFDHRFDTLWQRASPHYPIIAERSAAFLTWRYRQSPGEPYSVFCLSQQHHELCGYVIYRIHQGVCSIVDLLALNTQDMLRTLLSAFIQEMREQKTDILYIRYLGNSALKKALKQFNFMAIEKNSLSRIPLLRILLSTITRLKQMDESPLFLYAPPALSPLVMPEDNWYILLGDSDIP